MPDFSYVVHRHIRKFHKRVWRFKCFLRALFNLPDRPISRGKFCDYCSCEDCQNGNHRDRSIACENGTNICAICLYDDNCEAGCSGGKPTQPCKHKPKPGPEEIIYKIMMS